MTAGPLAGVRVLELGSLIAGPFCGRILADFGAEVLKIEPPGVGDPLRTWSLVTEHGSLWAMTQSRNKQSVTRRPAHGRGPRDRPSAGAGEPGRDRELPPGPDGGVGPRVRGSGEGEPGPGDGPHLRVRPDRAVQPPAGLRERRRVDGRHPLHHRLAGSPPLRVGLSIGDSIAALYAVIGTMMALRQAERTGQGQVVDVALSESVFSMLEAIVPGVRLRRPGPRADRQPAGRRRPDQHVSDRR